MEFITKIRNISYFFGKRNRTQVLNKKSIILKLHLSGAKLIIVEKWNQCRITGHSSR